jgi:hypothetical protein
MRKAVYLGIFLLFVAGCRVFDISEEQAQQIADMAGKTAEGLTNAASWCWRGGRRNGGTCRRRYGEGCPRGDDEEEGIDVSLR